MLAHAQAQAQVTQLAPADKRALERFVALERALLGGEPLFGAEPDGDVARRLSNRSVFSQESAHALLIASDGRDVARCAAMINRRWQRAGFEDVGFIGYFAAAPRADAAVAELLATAEHWLAEHGARRVIAPFNGDAFHGLATQVDAFDEPALFPMRWQPPHYPALFEAGGYRAAYPLWVYEIDLASERYRAVSREAITDARCAVRTFDKKRWNEELETLRRLHNETFRDEWEFHAITAEEYREFFGAFKAVLDERQMLFAEIDGEPVGFCFGLQDWNPLFRSFKGKMGPTQIARLLWHAKRFDRAGLLMIGVHESQRRQRIAQTLASTLYRYYEERGLKSAAYHVVNERNLASRRLAESFGGRGRNLYTVYEKRLG